MGFFERFRKYMSEHRHLLCFIVNFACFLIILLFFGFSDTPEDYDKAMRLSVIAFVSAVVVSWGIISLGGTSRSLKIRKKPGVDPQHSLKNIVPLDLIYKFSFPVLISDPNGYILWNNGAASEHLSTNMNMNANESGDRSILRKSVSAISGNRLSPEKFLELHDAADSEDGKIDFSANGRYFSVSMHKFSISQENSPGTLNLFLFVFDDVTEREALKREAEMKDPAVAYFMIDNLDEANQKMQDKYRNASGEVSVLLNEIVESCGGVIKEFNKDRYLCVFENKDLRDFIKSKFGVLDSVRDIKIEELNMPVTVSGGVSNITGSLFEKEAAARRALDLALQRGGDQVVVKGLSSDEFFGGKTKTVQKRTKVRSRVIAGELAQHMKNSSNILIMGHKYADNDSIGACVGIARFAMSVVDCEVNIIVNIHDPNIKSAFAKLRGLDEYAHIFIDEPAALDKITAETLVVIADVNNPPHFESEAVFKNVYKCAVIDHHRKAAEYVSEPDVVYIEPSASSSSELVAEILEQSLAPGQLLKEEAELLLAGIFLDTKNFSRNTGTRTFSAALYLRGEGANPSDALVLLKTNVEEFTKESQFASNIITYRNSVAISIFEEEASVTDKTAGAKAADRMLSIDGIEASFVIFRIEGTVHISARSLGKINVQIILEALGGGGHFDMAGAQIRNSGLKEVLISLKKTIDEYFDAG
jgi:c-di-AMP phosphodiesterase-like protein